MANPNKNPDYKAHLPMQSHDLSHKFAFTASTGMILPVAFDFVQAGEKLSGKVASYIQLKSPLVKNAKFDMEQIVDYFFVPMPMLYQPFESMVFQTNDFQSSAINFGIESSHGLGTNYAQFPCLDLRTLVDEDSPFFAKVGDVSDYWCSSYFTFLRTGLGSDYRTFNNPEHLGKSMSRLFDMLGLNSVAPFIHWPKHISGGSSEVSSSVGTGYIPAFFPWQLLAYHCIYEYYYRIDMFERFDQRLFNWDRYFGKSAVYPSKDGSGADKLNIMGELGRFFLLHYRPRYLDYFTNVSPTPYVQMASYIDPEQSATELIMFKDWLSSSSICLADVTGDALADDSLPSATQLSDETSSINASSSLRNLFAADRFLQIQSRAANRFDDQVLAHLGYKIPHDPKHNLMYLGTDRQTFNLQTLEASATTEQMNMGEKMGQLTSQMDAGGFKFTAPTYGVFMACMSIIVKPRYYVQNQRHNFINSIHDLWFKEYDNLGKQPVFAYEVRNLSGHYAQNGEILGEQSSVYAWQYRYSEKKRRFDRVSTAFARFVTYDIEQIVDDQEDFKSYSFDASTYNQNVLASYYSVRVPQYHYWNAYLHQDLDYINNYSSNGLSNYENRSSVLLEDIFESPTALNGLLGVPYETRFFRSDFQENPASLYDSDPFIIDCDVILKKLSPMSVYSMPELDKF